MTELRPYQETAVSEILDAPERRICLVAATGSGKTVIAAEAIRRSGMTALFFAHRREIIAQTQTHLAELGITAGAIMSDRIMDLMRGVQVATVQTLYARFARGKRDFPPAGLVFVDEAHHGTAASYRAVLTAYPDAKIVGLTATPCRRDGRGLGGIFERLIETPQIPELIKQGYLVPTRVWAPSSSRSQRRSNSTGRLCPEELAARMDTSRLVGDVITHYHRLARRRKTVVFATWLDTPSISSASSFCRGFVPSISAATRLRSRGTPSRPA